MYINQLENAYNDIIYFTSLYPNSILAVYQAVQEYCDKLEYEGSIMYDEYPDHEYIISASRHIAETVGEPMQELVEVLLLNEFIFRRIRRNYYSQPHHSANQTPLYM